MLTSVHTHQGATLLVAQLLKGSLWYGQNLDEFDFSFCQAKVC